jgi:hypothetical protein
MYKLLLIAGFLVSGLYAPAQKVINDPNVQVRSVSGFHAISASDAFDIYISQANEEKVAVSASEEKYLQDIITTVKNGVLIIKYDEGKKIWRGNHKLKAYISVKNINELRASGASTYKIEGRLSCNDLKIDLSGASKLTGQLEINGTFSASLSGASDIQINGSAKETNIDARGASDVKAFDFTTAVCSVKASGACNIKISVDKELSAHLSGASSVNYKGSAMIKDIKTTGASNISRKS